MRIEKKKTLLMVFVMLVALLLINSYLVLGQASSSAPSAPLPPGTMEAPPEVFQGLQATTYLYPTADFNPWTQVAWKEDYCNKTGMDFLVLIEPTACSPAVVRSDLLEEQDVPVLCRMTGIKINPLIQVPYIKSTVCTVENKSNEIAFVNFLPARVALSYTAPPEKRQAGLEGVPTMNNLGYLWIQLKQQPVEARMPESVKANIACRITYDVARTYGVTENQIVLPLLSNEEWLSRYKEFGFWRGKGYLKLQEITGTNTAKIAVYTNPRGAPLKVVELREGVEPSQKDEIMLPGFYCGAGLRLKLEKLTTPTTRARVLVNGNELLLENNDEILDSGCRISDIKASKGYGGSVTIYCSGGIVGGAVLSIEDYEANIEITDSEGKKSFAVSVGDNITVNKSGEENLKKIYVGFIGKEYGQEGFRNFIIFFYGEKFRTIEEKDVEQIVNGIHEYVKSKRGETLDVSLTPETMWSQELRKLFEGKSYAKDLRFFVIKEGLIAPIPDLNFPVNILSVTGPEQVYYKKETEAIYKEAIEQWKNIAFAYSSKASPEGTYYGILALHNAADLARDLHKRLDQAEILKELIDKYSGSEEPEIIAEVENAREELRRAVAGGGNRIVELSRPNGNYRIELISIDKPGLGTKEAQVELNGTKATLTVDDIVDGWVVTEIDETGIRLKNLTNYEESVAVGSWKYFGQTRLKLLNTVLKREAKVSVLPFEKTRITETNFSVAIGIEKRAIKLSPEKTQELITKLDKTIASLESVRDKLGKIVTVWKKACFAGATALWIKNFVTGLGGDAYARKLVMEPWSEKCADPSYRESIKAKSISDCYRINEQNINQDISLVKNSISKTNKFISDIKAKEGVVTKGGLLGLSQTINNDKFIQEAQENFPRELRDITIYEEKELRRILDSDGKIKFRGEPYNNISDLKKQNPGIDLGLTARIINHNFSSSESVIHLKDLYSKGRLFRDDVKELVLNLDLYKECSSRNDLEESALCKDVIKESYGKLKYISEQTKEITETSTFYNIFGFNPSIARPKEAQSLKAEVRVAEENFINKFDFGNFQRISSGERFSVFSHYGLYYIAVVEPAGNRKFTIKRLYEIPKLPESANEKVQVTNMIEGSALAEKLTQLQISDVEEIDPTLCNNNEMKQGPAPGESSATIKFWESGPYQGFVAFMPLDKRSGWYFATTSYSGLEGAMIAWKENADLNTFWICNVGPDGVPNFDYSTGGKGDDCCTLVSFTTGTVPEIFGCATPGCSQQLVMLAKKCSAEAIKEFAAGKRKIHTSCGDYNLGKPPAARPAAQCEDYMSPSDCRIMYNLCDPVMCPASRCDFGGRIPVENVMQSGVIGSIMLCLPNFEDGKGVLVPVCLTGVYSGLDSFVGILKSGRDCLQEQLKSGKTVGICDQIMSIYICEFFWKQFDPFLRAGLPSLAESLTTRGGGEYALFSESWKQSMEAARYFTDFYALQSFKAFKARSTGQIGTEICKKYASIAYPTQAKFWEELSKPESYAQATAWFDEMPMGGASPDSHYKVFFYIWAGRDQGAYYSVYLRRAAQPGYYEVPEEYLVKDGFGYVPAGQYITMSSDFTAPSGYKEICIRLNDKEICGFGKVSTNFVVNELQDYYLKDQLTREVTSAKECVSGSPTIMPTATLNIQSYVESALEPQIYKRGVVRICASGNPGEPVQQKDRYRKVGYCDNPAMGCWLDLESVNQSIADLKIRKDVITEADRKDLNYAINFEGLDKPDASRIKLENAEPKIIDIEKKIDEFRKDVSKKTKDELMEEGTKKELETRIEAIDKEILPLISEFRNISEHCARSDEKARADFNIAKLYDLRARLHAAPEAYKIDLKRKEEMKGKNCSELGGVWKDSCNESEEDITGEVNEDDKKANEGKKCCRPLSAKPKKEKLDVWPVDINAIESVDCYGLYKYQEEDFYNREGITQKSDSILMYLKNNQGIKAIAGGEIVQIKEYDFGVLVGKYTSIIINHSGEFYSQYYGKLSHGLITFDVVREGQVIAAAEQGLLSFWIYEEDPVANPRVQGKNPFCYFNDAILTTFYNKGICKKNIEECRKMSLMMPSGPFKTWPLLSYQLGSKGCYGYRTLDGKKDFHDGIDIVPKGNNLQKQVFAVASGVVYDVNTECSICDWNSKENCNCGNGYGNYVVIKHSNNLFTRYSHLGKVKVRKGDKVHEEESIGEVGSTGYSSGPHLDFKVYTNESDVNGKDKGKHPLCFFTSEIRNKVEIPQDALDDSKKYTENVRYGHCLPNASMCQEVLKEAGIQFELKEEKCGGLNNVTCIEKKGQCWWDSSDKQCRDCLDNCEGKRKGFFGIDPLVKDTPFKTQQDCEEQAKIQCGLRCLWVENKCQKISVENVNKKMQEIDQMSSGELMALRKLIEENRGSLGRIDSWLRKINEKLSEISPKPSNVFLVSKVNNGGFTTENKLVNYSDEVEICAVIEVGNKYYSGKSFRLVNRNIEKYSGTANIRWYNIVPLYLASYDGTKKVYELPPYQPGTKDMLQYEQELLNEDDKWCINAQPNVGTYWYRVEVSFDGRTWYSSLGKPAGDDDKNKYRDSDYAKEDGVNFDKYFDVWNTLLEYDAVQNFGISEKVHRISRKSNYAETTCKDLGYDPSDKRCQFISNVEAYKNVPFALGCVSYSCEANPSNSAACPVGKHAVESFISLDCINLMIGALKITTGKNYNFNDFDSFIREHTTITLGKGNNGKPSPVSFDSLVPSSPLIFGKEKQVEPGDIIFMWTQAKGFTHTFIIYNDTGKKGFFDEDDIVVYASQWCPNPNDPKNKDKKKEYDGQLCYAPIGRYKDDDNLKFILVKIKNLQENFE